MLTVSFATRDRPPASAWGREVNLWRDDVGHVFARGYTAPGQHRIDWPGLGTFEFRPGSRSVTAWLDAGARPAEATDAVLRILQPMILQALGWQALHASASVLPDGVVGFCGRSHSGKSTLAYAMAAKAFPQFADDAVVLDVSAGEVTAIPLPFSPRLRESARGHFGAAAPDRDPTRAAPLRLVVVLEQDANLDTPAIERIPPVPAFSALMTHAHCFDPAPGENSRRLVEDLLTVAGRVPVVRLRYAPDLEALDDVIDAVLDGAIAAGRVDGPAPGARR